jgi:hypothetical protein
VRTAKDPIFHKKAKAAALRDRQLLRKPVGARSRKRSTRKIPKMMAPAECPIVLTSCDSSMPDIDQLESIPIGTMRPPQKSYSGQAYESSILQVPVLGRIEQRDLCLGLPMFYTSKIASVSSLFHNLF